MKQKTRYSLYEKKYIIIIYDDSFEKKEWSSAGGSVLAAENRAVPWKAWGDFYSAGQRVLCRGLARGATLSHVAKRATVHWTEIYRCHNLYSIGWIKNLHVFVHHALNHNRTKTTIENNIIKSSVYQSNDLQDRLPALVVHCAKAKNRFALFLSTQSKRYDA